ncbi:AAA ATPase, putative [Perkinsus marinus ATCC 50983]|uniref:AAA ATPase, putative n=1 Tax=Perkinsus marinus (strain ATCC 50983 / TXsc) TaxID=423536 RepID=C5LAW3_PERM5|nr:AAA ATPase, putative [Perkinsus marinus ATCC 50983]EER06132.1 AAA ATPase, putative [Perkinsus marinus ATCC 50983]|eukprot:XP_002774316.1 AAA ATPase, putative [Perkinsus marinus ATCC 50983]
MVDRLLLSRIHATSRDGDTRNVTEIVTKLREKWPEYRRLKMPVLTRVVQGEFPPPPKPAPCVGTGSTTPSSSEEETSTKAPPDTTAMNDALDNMYLRHQQKQQEEDSSEDVAPAPPTPAAAAESKPVSAKKRKRARLQGAYMNDLLAGSDSSQKKFEPEPRPELRLANVGGFEKVKADIEDLIIRPISHREVYENLGVSPPVGVLLHGPPGSGKTMLATAIAGELGCAWFKVSAPEIVSGVSGESEATLRSLFATAVSNAPCIVLIDEIDAICPRRETAAREMERRIVSQMQISMDALWKTGVVVIGTTSRPDSVEPALRRSGRFDREIAMGMPDRAARAMILRTVTNGMSLAEDVDVVELGRRCPGYVGADLSALAVEAAMCAAKRSVDALEERKGDGDEAMCPTNITMDDFTAALGKVQPSAKREGFSTVPDVTWEDVGSLRALKDELNDCICAPILYSEIHEKFGLTVPAGVLLFGPPGCGKTLLAKAVANASNANFISVKGPELINKYVGESERGIRQVFQRAATSSPCVIFFDEIDAIVPSRQNSDSSQSSERVVNQLLSELDGMNSRREVFVIAATNRPDIIDPAILRPGRLGRLLYVPLPDEPGRADILATLLKKLPVSDDVDVKELGARTVRFSGADLANLVREASMRAVKRIIQDGKGQSMNTELITVEDFTDVLGKLSPSVSEADERRYLDMKASLHTTIV